MGRPKSDGSNRFDPTKEIIYKFIEEKGFTDKTVKFWHLRKLALQHLKDVKMAALDHTDGIVLPAYMGVLQVMGVDNSTPLIDRYRTKLSFQKGENKIYYHQNFHTNGVWYKLFYRTYSNASRNIRFAYFKNKDLWGYKNSRDTRLPIHKRVMDKSVYYHVATKEYLSNRKHCNQTNNLENKDDDQW